MVTVKAFHDPKAGTETLNRPEAFYLGMSEDGSEDGEPAVELGSANQVEGAPIARIASRLSWPQEKGRILSKVGEETIRTPDGPQQLNSIIADVETSYFGTRQQFLQDIEAVIGRGPIPTRAQK